jgi:hypothetical protein
MVQVDRLVPTSSNFGKFIPKEALLAEPSLSHLRQLMRHVFANPLVSDCQVVYDNECQQHSTKATLRTANA